jgi:hypothetical protein
MDLTQTWVYAPLPETQADAVQLGDSLRVVMPSGATIQGKVINKAAEADFATQRDVSTRKRDIKTIQSSCSSTIPASVCARHDRRGLHSQEQAGEAVSAPAIRQSEARNARPPAIAGGEHRQALRHV